MRRLDLPASVQLPFPGPRFGKVVFRPALCVVFGHTRQIWADENSGHAKDSVLLASRQVSDGGPPPKARETSARRVASLLHGC